MLQFICKDCTVGNTLGGGLSNPDPIGILASENLAKNYPFSPFTNNIIKGKVFINQRDEQGENEYNTGETVLAGTVVSVVGPLGTYTATANSSGDYEITGLPTGNYKLHKFSDGEGESNPIPNAIIPIQYASGVVDQCLTTIKCKKILSEKWVWGTTMIGGVDYSDADIVKAGVNIDNSTVITNNLIYVYTNKLKGQCIDDKNGDGQLSTYPNNPADGPVAGCNFEVKKQNGEVVYSTIGNFDTGPYLEPGTYIIKKLNNLTGKLNTNTTKSRSGEREDPTTVNLGSVSEVTLTITNTSIYQKSTINFFQFTPVLTSNSSITGKVFRDKENNGSFDISGLDEDIYTLEDNDEPIGGVQVNLSGTGPNGITINRQASTAVDGKFQFTDLPQGTYTVTATGLQVEIGNNSSGDGSGSVETP